MKKIVVFGLIMLLSAFSAQAKPKKEKKNKEKGKAKTEQTAKAENQEAKAGAIPYPFTGPDTGFGLGVSGLFRDLGNKTGRDLTFSGSYSVNQYDSLSLEWKEPQLFSKNGWGDFYIVYDNKPSRLFYGIGNNSSKDNVSSFGNSDADFEPRYDYWFNTGEKRRIGLKVNYRFASFDARNGPIDLKDVKTLSQRQTSVVFPEFYHSSAFQDAGYVSGAAITLMYDDRKDKFPVGGGRDEVVYPYFGGRQELYVARYDKAVGSKYDYTNYSANLSYYLPLGWEWTVLALHGAINIKDGDVPWWDMNSFGAGGSEGGTNTLRGYHDGRFRDNDLIIFNAELRQAFDVEFAPLPFWILKNYKIRAPGVTVFYDYGRVYHDVEDIKPDFQGFHWTYGVGLRFIISPSVVVRVDYAFSKEESDYYLTSGWPF